MHAVYEGNQISQQTEGYWRSILTGMIVFFVMTYLCFSVRNISAVWVPVLYVVFLLSKIIGDGLAVVFACQSNLPPQIIPPPIYALLTMGQRRRDALCKRLLLSTAGQGNTNAQKFLRVVADKLTLKSAINYTTTFYSITSLLIFMSNGALKLT